MKKIINIILGLVLFANVAVAVPARADTDTSPASDINFWSRSDYQEHMATSYAVAFTSYHLLKDNLDMSPTAAILVSTIGTLALGFARDQFLFHHTSNIGDYMKANFIGVSASTFLCITFSFDTK